MSKHYLICSRESVRRFTKLILSLRETPFWFHQVLTFKERIEDPTKAKKILKTFLDSIHFEMRKHGEMATVFLMGRQKEMSIHFHLLFLFYAPLPSTPEQLAEILRREAWKRWAKLNKDVTKAANMLKIQTKPRALHYLFEKHVRVGKTKKEAKKTTWFGTRNQRLIKAHALPVTKKDIKNALHDVFPLLDFKPKPTVVEQKRFSRRELLSLKAYLEADGRYDWEDFKRRKTGRKGKVSDADYMAFCNGWTSGSSSSTADGML